MALVFWLSWHVYIVLRDLGPSLSVSSGLPVDPPHLILSCLFGMDVSFGFGQSPGSVRSFAPQSVSAGSFLRRFIA